MSLETTSTNTAHSFTTYGLWNSTRTLIVGGWWNVSISFSSFKYFWDSPGFSCQVLNTGGAVDARIKKGTTDSSTTSGANQLVIDTWSFIAASYYVNSSSVADVKIWFGDKDKRPTLVSGTTTAGLGGLVSSDSITLGLNSTCINGFASNFSVISFPNGGVATTPSESFLNERFITPLYLKTFNFQNMLTNPPGDAAFGPGSAAQTFLTVPLNVFAEPATNAYRAVGYLYTGTGAAPLTLVSSLGGGTSSFFEPPSVRTSPLLSPTSRR